MQAPSPIALPAARVLIVEDHPLYRDGMLALLERSAPQLQCQVAEHAEQALYLLRAQLDIDLVLSDLRLPGSTDGLALLARVGQEFPTSARVLTSGSEDPSLTAQAKAAGLMGYLPKHLEPQRWMEALAQVMAGTPWFPDLPALVKQPTERQLSVLQHLVAGHANKEIARAMGITERTVKYHLTELFDRLGAANRTQAVSKATALGWVRAQ